MELIITAAVLLGLLYVGWKYWPKADVNQDGKVDATDAKVLVAKAEAKVEAEVKEVVAKVEAEVKEEVAKVGAAAKKTATKAKETVKKTATKAKEKVATATKKSPGRPKKTA